MYSNSIETTTYTYDRNGNQLSQTTLTVEANGERQETIESSTFNAFNQLTTVVQNVKYNHGSVQHHKTTHYAYRADGLRRNIVANEIVTTYIWNGSYITAEHTNQNNRIIRYERCLSGRLLRSSHYGIYLYNVRSDVVQRINPNGTTLQVYQYDAFGNELNSNSNDDNPFRYAGEYFDKETGTYYLRARRYNPRTGRFTQADPFWNVNNMQGSTNAILQASNLYVYVMNNPLLCY